MSSEEPEVILTSPEGKHYILVDAFAMPVCALYDGLRVHQFKGRPEIYAELSNAKRWVEKECRLSPAYARVGHLNDERLSGRKMLEFMEKLHSQSPHYQTQENAKCAE